MVLGIAPLRDSGGDANRESSEEQDCDLAESKRKGIPGRPMYETVKFL